MEANLQRLFGRGVVSVSGWHTVAHPRHADLPERVRAVTAVIYLIYNEGYTASGGDRLIPPSELARGVRKFAKRGYENDVITIVTKLLERNPSQ